MATDDGDWLSCPHPDYSGALLLTAVYLAVSIGVLIVFPPDNWDERWPTLSQLAESWTGPPVWRDGDPWFTNYVGHPLMGLVLYAIARYNRGAVVIAALFTLGASTVWEYVIEAWFEPPSWPDLIITPIAGALLGELQWRARRAVVMRGAPTPVRIAALAFLAPLASARAWRRRRRGAVSSAAA
jgi:hypothetical protein